jgi:hypothetical protein
MRPSHYIKSLMLGVMLTLAPSGSIYGQNIPQAKCLSAYGETKCGYSCVAAYGEIRCADWPGGVCQAAYGDIVCGPPAPANWPSLYNQNNDNLPVSNHETPRLHWSIYNHNLTRKDCSVQAYNSMKNLRLSNIKYYENKNNKFDYLTANWENNALRIACLNNTIMILWAGNN